MLASVPCQRRRRANLDPVLYGLSEQFEFDSDHLSSDLGVTLGSFSAVYNLALLGNRVGCNSAFGEDARRHPLPHPAHGKRRGCFRRSKFPRLSRRDGRDALRRHEFRPRPLEDPFLVCLYQQAPCELHFQFCRGPRDCAIVLSVHVVGDAIRPVAKPA
jgi:hypothetical protein